MSKQNKAELLKGWKSEIASEIIAHSYSNEYNDYVLYEDDIIGLSTTIVDYIQELFDDPEIIEAMTSKILKSDINTGPESADS